MSVRVQSAFHKYINAKTCSVVFCVIVMYANMLVLVTFGMLMVYIAFNIDADAMFLAVWGAVFIACGIVTTVSLFFAMRRKINRFVLAVSVLLNTILITHELIKIFDIPDMERYMKEGIFHLPPLVVPILSLGSLYVSRKCYGNKLKGHCQKCGYSLEGLLSKQCPECGDEHGSERT